jgi:hypothetical protein
MRLTSRTAGSEADVVEATELATRGDPTLVRLRDSIAQEGVVVTDLMWVATVPAAQQIGPPETAVDRTK